MNIFKCKRMALLACAIALAGLAGCGGGGGGSTPGGAAPAPTPVVANLVMQVTTPTYAAGSNEQAAFDRLDAQRGRCGFGLLAQNARIDQAAAAHVSWMQTNKTASHLETTGTTGYTGESPATRMGAAGYSYGSTGEDLEAGGWGIHSIEDGATAAEVMLDLPYHGYVALLGFRDVGISWAVDSFVLDFGTLAGLPMQSAGGVRTYPCDGTTSVLAILSNESPSPFPSESNPSWGPTVHVFGTKVQVTKASVTGPAGSVAIKVIYTDGGTVDPNGDCNSSHACVIPQVLQVGTTYTVHIEGTQAGSAFVKDFSFQTAS